MLKMIARWLQAERATTSQPGTSSPMAPAAGVSLVGINKVFPGQRGAQVHALKDVTLSIQEGELVCLIGASGCGKSTLLRIIAGFDRPSPGGEVTVRGLPVQGPGADRGVVFQDYGLFPWLSVADNIAYGPRQRRLPKEKVQEITRRFTALVHLSAFADKFPHELSGGMQQRVAIARVLANDSAVLLMDEPFGALDSLTRQSMQEELRDIWLELRPTVVLVTHNVEEAVFLADRVVVMSGGPNFGEPGHIQTVIPIPLAHPRDVTSPEFNALRRELLAVIHGEPPAPRYLIVANQTMCSPEMLQSATELAADNPKASFALLVPATHPSQLLSTAGGDAYATAQKTAERARNLFRSAGLQVVTAEVGSGSPLEAIEAELAARPSAFSAVVIGSLPPGVSRWLVMDVYQQAEQRFALPIIRVVAQPAEAGVPMR